ncbi:membrane-bound lytic murein transglycosylase B [Mariprofundus ferrinatatus]|uniref:Membrane-bound lytic murein transglycosylase B n=2 Tax=Mariprofundus ferrinatatus TaxID=1921087 RepID=A0A2K8L3E4_9PROT|nr:membrane-bound lytic murein transglycosylase B [Mariprofundus ferrinatatus]
MLVWLTILMLPFQLQAADKKPDGKQHTSREELALQLASETGIKADVIRSIIAPATFRPQIIERMNRQWEAEPYLKYRPLFVKESMQEKGRAYLKENHKHFTAIENKYRVDSVIVAAILGIETKFGEIHGSRPVLDSLYTLSTGFPRRAKFFRQQLGAIIQISLQDHLKLDELKGSYAGAFGAIQFIPTSFRDYAVDEDGDGVRNVFDSKPDIIASVANYFREHGWQHGRPSAYWLPAGTKLTTEWRKQAKGKLEKWVTLAELRKTMPKLFDPIPLPWQDDDKVSIIEMQTKHGKQFALVHYNFQVIMRYNSSYNYAMAVTEIAAMLERKKFAVD